MTPTKQEPDDWECGFVAGAADGGSIEPPPWITDTAAYAAGFADGKASRAPTEAPARAPQGEIDPVVLWHRRITIGV
jgi:hypothetical protein